MNERLLELARQAKIEFTYDPTETPMRAFAECWEDELAKFAELIVRECVDQMELVRKYRYDRVQPLENQQTIIDECQYQIKQHFGVEE